MNPNTKIIAELRDERGQTINLVQYNKVKVDQINHPCPLQLMDYKGMKVFFYLRRIHRQ
jgi:hypothetical protein